MEHGAFRIWELWGALERSAAEREENLEGLHAYASRGLPTEAVAGGLPVPCTTAVVTSSLRQQRRRWRCDAVSFVPRSWDGLSAGQWLLRDNCLTVGCMLFRVTSRLAVTRKAFLISPQRCRTLESTHTHLASLVYRPPSRPGCKQAEAVHDADRFGHDIRLGAVPLANAKACLLGRNEIVTLEQILVAIAGPFAIARAARFKERRRTSVNAPLSPSGRQETTVVVGRASPPADARSVVRHGSPVRLKFIRQGTTACSEEVVFPDLARRVQLDDGELVPVDFTPERAGEYEFISGTGAFRGKVIAR